MEREVRARLGDDIPYELVLARAADRGQRLAGRRPGRRRRSARSSPTEGVEADAAPVPGHRVHRLGLPARRGRHRGLRLQPVPQHARRGARGGLPQRRRADPRRRPAAVHPLPPRPRAAAARDEGARPRDRRSGRCRPASTTRSPTSPACASGTPPSSRARTSGPASRWWCRTTATSGPTPVYAGAPPAQRQRRDDRPALAGGGRPAALPRRADQHPQRRRRPRRAGGASRSRSCPTAWRPGRCRSSPRPGTAMLNDVDGFHVTAEHARAAYLGATGGPVAEGAVGGGTGMVCHEFKGGIGTLLRRVTTGADDWTVGVLVQANHGRRDRFTVNGVPVGLEVGTDVVRRPRRASSRPARLDHRRGRDRRPAAAAAVPPAGPALRRSASRAPAGSARTAAATCSSRSRPATAACATHRGRTRRRCADGPDPRQRTR